VTGSASFYAPCFTPSLFPHFFVPAIFTLLIAVAGSPLCPPLPFFGPGRVVTEVLHTSLVGLALTFFFFFFFAPTPVRGDCIFEVFFFVVLYVGRAVLSGSF